MENHYRIISEHHGIIENCTCLLRYTAERLAEEWTRALGYRCWVVVV